LLHNGRDIASCEKVLMVLKGIDIAAILGGGFGGV
jgi:hypothetical protein